MWEICGINERLRVLRYAKPGARFEMHEDAVYHRPSSAGPLADESSRLTVLVYLNDGYEGCPTTFYARERRGAPLLECPVPPKTGMVLVHDHRILHAATPLVSGVKYVVRTELMCRRATPAAAPTPAPEPAPTPAAVAPGPVAGGAGATGGRWP